jgi:hypothetical protein
MIFQNYFLITQVQCLKGDSPDTWHFNDVLLLFPTLIPLSGVGTTCFFSIL